MGYDSTSPVLGGTHTNDPKGGIVAKIDPKKRMEERKQEGWSEVPEEGGGGPERISMAVKCPAVIVGFERTISAEKRTPGIEVRFAALEGAAAGKVVDRTFWSSSAFNGQMADLALAIGWEEPFDPEEEEDLARVFSHKNGVVGIDVRAKDPYTGDDGKERINYEARFFYRVPADARPKKDGDDVRYNRWKEIKKAGVASWEGYLKWKEERAKKARGGGSGGGRRRDDDDGGGF